MSQLLINHNLDLQKLQSEGYDLEVRGGVIYISTMYLSLIKSTKLKPVALHLYMMRMVIHSVLQEITLPIGLEKNHVRNLEMKCRR